VAASSPRPDLPALIESLLFVASRPLSVSELASTLDTSGRRIERGLALLGEQCRTRGVRVQRQDGLVQLVSAPEAASWVERFLGTELTARLSPAAVETLAVVAYRQPITRPEIDALRGVNSESALRTLIARGLVAEDGRRPTVGRPVVYVTTFAFLEYFGLGGLHSLPAVDARAGQPSPTVAVHGDQADGG
jgi:segregation and condensation protein B